MNKIKLTTTDIIASSEVYSLCQAVANIAYTAGAREFYVHLEQDIENIILWAQEFQKLHEATDWAEIDYFETIESFANNKIAQALAGTN